MNAVRRKADTHTTAAVAAPDRACASAAHPPAEHALRRTGQRPLRFDGWCLIEAVGTAEPGGIHHDLRLFRTTRGRIVAELVARRAGMQAADTFRVESFSDLATAAAWLEAYPSADDVPVPGALACADAPLAMAALQAVRLRQCAARVTEEYRGLLSDVFASLGLSDTLDAAELPEAA